MMSFPLGRYCLRLLPQDKLAPIARIRFLRRLCGGTSSLFPPYQSLIETGQALRNPVLRRTLRQDEMGTWSMSPATMNFLESELAVCKPEAMLELGGGLSTICFAQYMSELHPGKDGVRLCSLEQNASVVESTVKRLKSMGLDGYVRMFYAPVASQTIEGKESLCYSLPPDFVPTMNALDVNFIVIDGPAVETTRFGSLPLIRPCLKGSARFYLDDALRDSELEVAGQWAGLSYVQLEGIRLTKKGLLVGTVQGGKSSILD